MAKILDKEEQQKALKNVNDSIRELQKGNEFLAAQNPTGLYTITFTDKNDKKRSLEIRIEEKTVIDQLFLNFKKTEKERIEKLAEEHRLELDEKDIQTLSFDGTTPDPADQEDETGDISSEEE